MEDLRQTFDTGRTLSVEFRREQLNQLYRLVDENYDDLIYALNKDLRKSKMEAGSFELEGLKQEIRSSIKELKNWEQRSWLPFNLLLPFDSAFTKRDPYGVVLIIGAWNYPFLLSLQPLIGAITGMMCTSQICMT